MKRRIVCLLLLVALTLSFAGCGGKNPEQDAGGRETLIPETDNKDIISYIDDEDCYTVETRYGTLEYPEKWKDMTKTEIMEEPIYTVKFSGKTSAGEIPLFELSFNDGGGNRIGSLKADGLDVPVFVYNYSFDKSTLSDEEYFNCCSMQEDVVVILEHLAEDHGFTFD